MANLESLDVLREHLPAEVRALPREKQIEYLSELLSHRHRHHRDEEEQVKAYQELRSLISEQYCPLHPDLYQLRGWQVAESFRQAVQSGDRQSMRTILTEERPGVYTFDMLSEQTCRHLVEEVHHFETWCKQHQLRINRPNTMNEYGAILDDFGFQPVLDELMKEYIQPFSVFLYPSLGQKLDSHHGFVVEYELGKDINLGFHVDDSEVTLNVCLGNVFTGGQLFFKGVRCDKHVNTDPLDRECFDLEHRVGKGIFHVGRHRHGARDLTSGYRINLIVWCRSSHQRQSRSAGACACSTPCPQWCALHTPATPPYSHPSNVL